MTDSATAQKRAVGEEAAALVEDGMTVGLGTGSTAGVFVQALGKRVRAERLRVRGVPTSEQTGRLAAELGIPLATLDEVDGIALTVDGADELTPNLDCIKGGGGALLREKLVWEASIRRVVIVDQAKRVDRLGAFRLPIEVVDFGHVHSARRIGSALSACGVGGGPTLRSSAGQPIRTEGGNLIYDVDCGSIPDAPALASALKAVTGVVDHGLFLGLATEALVGTPQGVVKLSAQREG